MLTLIEMNKGKSVFWTITYLVKYCLDTGIRSYIPNLHYFICS